MIIKTPFTSSIIFLFSSVHLHARYLYNFKFFYQSFSLFFSLLTLDNRLFSQHTFIPELVNLKATFLKPKNLIKKVNKTYRELKSNFFHFTFFSDKAKLHNNYYEIQGLNTIENWWSPKLLLSFKWNQYFFITFYSSSLKTFKYFYNNYFYIKSKVFFHQNFPQFTSITLSHQALDELEEFDTFSLNFLNLPEKKPVTLLALSWQLDFVEWVKAVNLQAPIIKKTIKRKKNFNLYQTNVFTLNFFYFNTNLLLQKQNSSGIKKRKWILYNKFFLITKDLILTKIKSFRNIVITEKSIFPIKFYFIYWRKTFAFRVKPRQFFQSFFLKNFTIHFFKTLPKSYHSMCLNTFDSNDLDLFFENSLQYYSHSSAPLLTSIPGFFFINSSKKTNDISLNLIPSLKIKIYSFFEKFDLHKLIIKNVTKSSFVNTFSPFSSPSSVINPLQLTSNLFKYNLVSCDALTTFSTNSVYDNFYWDKKLSWLLYFYNNLTVEYSNKLNLKIQRIKFKPGYMTYWRNARKELKNVLNLKFRYQFNLSRYISRYNKHNQYLTFLTAEMFLNTVLLNSKILPYRHIANDFIKNHFIYINGWCIIQENFQLYKNDFIQILIHLKYYAYYKYLMNLLIQDKLYVKKVVFYKNQHIATQKQKSSSYPDKLKKKFYVENDIPKYLEVDFFSLSIYILYDPFLVQDFSLEQHSLNRFSILRLYNWKYIT